MRKRTVIVGVVSAFLLLEITLSFVFLVTRGSFLASRVLENKIEAILGEPGISVKIDKEDKPLFTQNEVIHPYLGYVRAPKNSMDIGYVNFAQLSDAVQEEKFTVGIFGGSFAFFVATRAEDVLREQIALQQGLSKEDIVIVPIAMGGYKQPQQLMSFIYFLLMQSRFDIIVNIDGFNESVMIYENEKHKRPAAIYPHRWYERIHATPAYSNSQMLQGEIIYVQHKRMERAQWLREMPLRYSSSIVFAFHVLDAIDRAQLRRARLQKHETSDDTLLPGMMGPSNAALGFSENEEEALAQIWYRSTVLMHTIAQAFDIPYVHILQPNQYIEGTKPIGNKERSIAMNETQVFVPHLRRIYPMLQQRGAELRENNIHFYDATRVFATAKKPLYADTCCHLSDEGYEMFVPFIIQSIGDAMR
tara:strand:+ start:1380 stop:2633 length:1254 start_codon:yes stop_codon:yes gene_type:complete